MDTLYVETSIVSYLRQRPSPQVVMAARQVLTHQWWNDERFKYELVTSQYVVDEASAGDPVLAAERLELLDSIPLLPLDPAIAQIANEIMNRAILPQNARTDALHIAMVAHHRIQYLLTWNCRHIANATILPRIHKLLTDLSIPIPVICTPEEMVNDDPEAATDDRSHS
jgi:predicted nucleic acid-binding protein